jgi:hypothetical protein
MAALPTVDPARRYVRMDDVELVRELYDTIGKLDDDLSDTLLAHRRDTRALGARSRAGAARSVLPLRQEQGGRVSGVF